MSADTVIGDIELSVFLETIVVDFTGSTPYV